MEYTNKTEEIAALFNKAKAIQREKEQAEIISKASEATVPTASYEETKVGESMTSTSGKKSGALIGLSGIMEREDGTLTKTKYFDMIKVDESRYADISFTEDEARRVSMAMRQMTTGINASVPMICKGPECPFASTCPYVRENKAPIGRPCLVEAQLIDHWTREYIEEFDVDMSNLTEVYMIAELAEYNIYEKRVTQHLAEDHQSLMQKVVTSVDYAGNEIVNDEISRAWELKERIKKSRMKVLEALMATRKEKVKLTVSSSTGSSAAEQMSDLKKKLEEIKGVIGKMEPIEASIVDDED